MSDTALHKRLSGGQVTPLDTSASDLMTFENVCKCFLSGGTAITAVENINLRVRRSEIITLLGPSGCGKSTLLNMISGLMPPTSGSLSYRGMPVSGVNHRVGYMTQTDHLLPWRDVAGNISVPLEIRGSSNAGRHEKVASLVRLVGLDGFEHCYPSQLSGGMRKRTALARLLAYDPECLLLDEPFAALDAQLRAQMQSELIDISQRLKKTILFVTHDVDEAIALGTRCLVFSARPGNIIADLDLPRWPDRSVGALRRDPQYQKICGDIWDLLISKSA